MLRYLSYLSNPFILALVSGLALAVFMYIDSWYTNISFDFIDYIKFRMTAAAITCVALFIQRYDIGSMFGGARIKDVDVEGLYTGPPDF